ncbi:hypothetical protein BC829DRAFT_278397 [Chytridium lagenaria]|nr:hypothetical protein BC829DRAFT_278397 [Chytridium lagenaria]
MKTPPPGVEGPSVFESEKIKREQANSESASAFRRNARRRTRLKRPRPTLNEFLARFTRVVYIAMIGGFFLLMSLQLEWRSVGSWWAVFVPWYVAEMFHLSASITRLKKKLKTGVVLSNTADEDGGEETEVVTRPHRREEWILAIADVVGSWILRILLALLIPAKLSGSTTADWSVIFLPAYFVGILNLISVILSFFSLRHDISHEDYRSKRRQELVLYAVCLLTFGAIGYAFLALLIRRLQAEDILATTLPFAPTSSYRAKKQEMLRNLGAPSFAIILVPVFFSVGCVLLLVGCCLPCVVFLARVGIETELKAKEGAVPRKRGSTDGTSYHQHQMHPVVRVK